jgi:hypothetical protein
MIMIFVILCPEQRIGLQLHLLQVFFRELVSPSLQRLNYRGDPIPFGQCHGSILIAGQLVTAKVCVKSRAFGTCKVVTSNDKSLPC